MSKSPVAVAVLFLVALLALGGCVYPVERVHIVSGGQDPTPTLEPTATLFPTPTPTPTPTPPPTATPTPQPSPTPEPSPTTSPATPLFLELEQPADDLTVRTETVTVAGQTVPGTTIEVNADVVRVELDGRFQTQVTLTPGPNVIEVKATGLSGEQQRAFAIVTYEPPPPPRFRLEVFEPPNLVVVYDQPILVSGRTIPQATVTVNGVGVAVDEEGNFSTMVNLTEGVNVIDVVAFSPTGGVLPATRSVTYAP